MLFRSRQEELIQRQRREVEEQRQIAERAAPEFQAKVAARREDIRRMLDVMRAGSKSGKRS